jgi:CubicO group peptidase (beta-lactamase class C family)
MNYRQLAGIAALSSLLAAIPVETAHGESSADEHFEELSAFVRKSMTESAIPGAAIGVLYRGDANSQGFGVTNIEHPLGVQADTLFQVGSITKTMTGTILMQLADQGKLDIDAPVRRYVPEFRVQDAEATEFASVRHLLSHMGGWVGDYFSPTGEGDDALDRVIAQMRDLPQLAPFNTVYSYNNSGYYVAGKVIENITGEPYEAAFEKLMVEQLGLRDTYIRPADVMTKRFAVGHQVSDSGTTTAAPYALFRAAYAAGGAIMSVGDLLKYAAFHMGDGTNAEGERVISPAALSEMQTAQAPKLGADGAIGLTWHIDDVGPVHTMSHGGATVGQIAQLVMVPERDFALAIVTNANTGRRATGEIVDKALELYLNVADEEPEAMPLSPAQLEAYVGVYSRPFADIKVTLEDGELLMQQILKEGFPDKDASPPDPAPPSAVEFFAEDQVRAISGWWSAQFVRKPDGNIGWLRYGRRIHLRQAD